jgi:N utilization substance protein A
VREAAREAGERAKVAVASTKRDVDPIGACVGLRGTRIQVISRELRGEKIDIVEWSPDPATFVARALSPAKVSSVTVADAEDEMAQPSVLVIVPDSQLSLAIGKRGLNARLAAKLTGLRVDIKSESEVEDERRREEAEFIQGREVLSTFPGLGPDVLDRLISAGLFSAPRLDRAGVARVAEVARAGEGQAARWVEAAQAWVAEHGASAAEAPAQEDAVASDLPASAADEAEASGSPSDDVPRSGVASSPAE